MSIIQKLPMVVGEHTVLQPLCPGCGMLLRRTIPSTDTVPSLRSYACDECAASVIESTDHQLRQR
jgi:hypothetical protein